MPIIRAREDKEGERGVCVCVSSLLWWAHMSPRTPRFILKLCISGTLYVRASLLTDSLSLTPDHSDGAPAIWPRLKNTLMISQGSGGRASRLMSSKSAIIFHKQPPLWKLKVYPSSKFSGSVFEHWLLWIQESIYRVEVVGFPGYIT